VSIFVFFRIQAILEEIMNVTAPEDEVIDVVMAEIYFSLGQSEEL